MEYKAVTAVWEITMGCNMRCKHCGSSCKDALENELTTEEALGLCDDLGKLGLEWITLSGGEPTTRKDWHLIAQRLRKNGIIPTMITNGWLLDEDIVDKAMEADIGTIAISIDGLEDTHDFIRKKGSFQRIMKAFDLLKRKGSPFSAITTVTKENIAQLSQLRDILVEKGVASWQVQIGLPMGNMSINNDWTIEPRQMDDIIDFAHETMKQGKIVIQPADCIGYYNLKEIEIRTGSFGGEKCVWQGCNAGKHVMGILHNGDIIGCTSIRDRKFIEGNIRKTPLDEIWNNPEGFSWNRNMDKKQLDGLCSKCQYGSYCLGGCSNTRIVMGGSIYAENKYCSYNVAVSKAENEFAKIKNYEEFKIRGRKFLDNGNLQLAESLLAKAMEMNNNDTELLGLYGYVSFMLGNYDDSEKVNQKVLELVPGDVYAHKGLGLCLCRQGKVDEGIKLLRRSVEMTDENFMDPYYDLAVVLAELDELKEALIVIEKGRAKSKHFQETTQDFYEKLKNSISACLKVV